ncbi:MAG: ABC transporter permease [Clostridia bacterium]|nr:ABC transporter permease [Clostridia bacterium]
MCISSLVKSSENVKIGMIIAITMLGSFFSGMMGITMKYIIDTNVPIINKINPASMITDGFYSIYYYDTLDRYFLNIGGLIIFSITMLVLAWSSLRRQKYDSI